MCSTISSCKVEGLRVVLGGTNNGLVSVLSFLGLILFLFGVFICVLVSPLGFVRFSLVVEFRVVFVGIS